MLAKPMYLKRKTKQEACPHCREPLRVQRPIIKRYYKGKVFWHYKYYHVPCWMELHRAKCEREIAKIEEWFSGNMARPKQMRTLRKSYIDHKKRRRLMALLRYHKKEGNLIRVMQLEDRVAELTRPVQ